jgi:glycosyltransferase involved in cell wall biosynthesis
VRANLFVPDARALWVRPTARRLRRYLERRPVDAMLSTGPPHSVHLIARALRRSHRVPWVADFRDGWTSGVLFHELAPGAAARRWHRALERSVLAEADRVVTVTPTMAADLRRLGAPRVAVVENGYDEGDFAGPAPPLRPGFALCHVGSLYRHRGASALWPVLRDLCAEVPGFRADLRLRFVGKSDVGVLGQLAALGLGDLIDRVDYLAHKAAVAEQRAAPVLLLLVGDAPPHRQLLTGKLYEYLAARRPILAVGPAGGDFAGPIEETRAGRACAHDDAAGLRAALLDLYAAYRRGELAAPGGDIARFSRRRQAARMALELDAARAHPV